MKRAKSLARTEEQIGELWGPVIRRNHDGTAYEIVNYWTCIACERRFTPTLPAERLLRRKVLLAICVRDDRCRAAAAERLMRQELR